MATPGSTRRHRVLGLAALATLVASIWALEDDAESAASRPAATGHMLATSARTSAGVAPASPVAERAVALALPERVAARAERRNLFAATAVVAVNRPASAALVAPAAPASAPAPAPITLPFSFAGRLVTQAGPSVLLNEGSTTRVLALGNTLGDFRFEQDNGQQLDFVHVPSGEHVLLALQP